MGKFSVLPLLVRSLEGRGTVSIKSFQVCCCSRTLTSEPGDPKIFGRMFSHRIDLQYISPMDRSIVVVERRMVDLSEHSRLVTLD